MKTPFEILGIAEDADDRQIKKAYLEAVRRYPPERYPEQFQRVRAAFEQIATEKARVGYMLFDTTLPEPEEIVDRLLRQRRLRPVALRENLRDLLGESVNDCCRNFDL